MPPELISGTNSEKKEWGCISLSIMTDLDEVWLYSP